MTSVSVDLHKYGYTPKGVSLVLWRDAELRRHTWFATADWSGYPVINTTLLSTKGGGPPAVAWSFLKKVGRDGYRDLALTAWRVTREMAAGIGGDPRAGDRRRPRGHDAGVHGHGRRRRTGHPSRRRRDGGAGLAAGGPARVTVDLPTAHLCVQAVHDGQVGQFLADLAAATEAARRQGRVAVDPGLLALAGSLDVAALSPAEVAAVLAVAGIDPDGDGLPERRAMLNAIIDAAPGPLVERLLMEVLGQVLRPSAG